MDYDRNDALLHWLFRQTQGDAWFRPNEQNISSGVALRISDVNDPVPEFRVFPYENPTLEPFETAVAALNPAVAVKIRSAAVHAALAGVHPDEQTVYVDANTRIQIIDTMLALPAADKEQCAAFIRDERVLVIWSDVLDRIVPTCTDFEDRLIKLLWRVQPVPSIAPSTVSHPHSPSLTHSLSHHDINSARSSIEVLASPPKRNSLASVPASSPLARPAPTSRKKFKRTWYGRKVQVPLEEPEDGSIPMDEKGVVEQEDEDSKWNEAKQTRRTMLLAPLYNGLAAGLSLIFIGNGIKLLFQEWTLDGGVTRIGPIEQYHSNSTYYSGVKPQANPKIDDALPHITIQMPVYKEGLEAVLAPSILSIKHAMQTYARQGGTSSIFICDDGLRLLPPHEQQERVRFYAGQGIGWVARPGHGALPDDVEGQSEVEDALGDVEKGLGAGKGKEGEKVERQGKKPFFRAGRFKKASNLNYGLALSLKAERHLAKLLKHQKEVKEAEQQQQSDDSAGTTENSIASSRRTPTPPPMPPSLVADLSLLGLPSPNSTTANGASTPRSATFSPSASGTPLPGATFPNPYGYTYNPAASLEDQALALAIAECAAESGFRPWAANGRNVRMGEIVLLVDSDTVVPEDCLRDAAREMGVCPDVAIIQHESDVMQVVHHYFENGIAYFTRRINRTISMACANGEVAPFVGHNAFLRWRALQDVAFIDPADGVEKIWSESNVSEDFDMALRLLQKGYIVRWATYSKGEFKEGVSLSVDDELNRWQKYAYGCSELLFHPFAQWFRRGPIAHQIHKFMWSSAPIHYKIAMMAYMFSYYGIAGSVTISIINYILLGLQFGVDRFYMHSFEIWLATTVVFFGSGTVGYSLLQYRLGQKQLIPAFLENCMWIPFFFFFFGGLSIPLTQAILAHMFSYNISWSATIKEVQRSNFFKEIPKIAKRFWFPIVVSLILILGVVICSTSLIPVEWRIEASTNWAVIFPVV
ncbi:hypothetical protein C0995_012187 [Termitomyces sp. Mi166|nr:hypothetical protein C0995_012187 [Termitomyces sp. Mi166\